MKRLVLTAALAASYACAAHAQTYRDSGGTIPAPVVPLVGCSASGPCAGPVSAANPMPVSGAFSASLGGFTPSASGARMTPLAVATLDSSGTLPSGAVAVVSNAGANPMYCNVNGVAATASDQLIAPSSWFAFTIPSGVTALHCIATGGGTTANAVGGAGLATGAGGGGGGSGGSIPTGTAGSPNASVVTVQGISGATGIPVTGTFWQATQPVSGTFWQTTQPVSLASLPSLAAGSATVGSFNLLGHAGGTLDTAAGTSASTLLTVQGSASGVPIPVSMASLPAYAATPTFNLGTLGGAATNAELVTINSTLGSPFQAGGSIGNTGFNVTGTLPAFASTPTFNLGTLGGAATAANQTNGSQKTQIVDGSGNVIGSTSNNLDVQCANCSGSGVSTGDEATFTAGSSLFAGSGGFFQTTATSNPLTTGHQGMAQMTAYRALMTDWYNSSGVEMGTAGSPVQVSLANTGANGTAVAVSAASLPLPTGAASATNQTNGSAETQVYYSGALVSASNPLPVVGAGLAQGSTTSGQSGSMVMGAVTTSAPSYTTAQTDPLSLDTAGNLRVNVAVQTAADACMFQAKSGAPINLTASGQVITGTASKKTYICSIDVGTATAQSIALVEGTGTTCATNTFGLAGGTTAATGWSLAANGGLTKGSGLGTVYSPSADTNATAANVCLLLSGSGQASGQITYVQQ